MHAAAFLTLMQMSATQPAWADGGVWPDLARPLPGTGIGTRDAALIVGLEDYQALDDVAGAKASVEDWSFWLTITCGVPARRITMLQDSQATAEAMRRAAMSSALETPRGGTLWFVFVGRGATASDGRDAVLLGSDADPLNPRPESQGVSLTSLVDILQRGDQEHAILVLDTSFPWMGQTDEEKSDPPILLPGPAFTESAWASALLASQVGLPLAPLPDLDRPAFGYLLLGALRGWGDQDQDGEVTAREALDFCVEALRIVSPGQPQAPALWGADEGRVLAVAREPAPDVEQVLWRSSELRVERRVQDLDTAEAALREQVDEGWQAVQGAWGDGGPDAQASVEGFIRRWEGATARQDDMFRWMVFPQLEEARQLLSQVRKEPAPERTVVQERYNQLVAEMDQRLRRNAWKGVESAYQEMMALQALGVELRWEDHLNGARGARDLGSVADVRERLVRAVRIRATAEAVQWLNDLERNYGRVRLTWERKGPPSLEPDSMPFAPDRRAAVIAACARLEAEQRFEGFLPAGAYLFGEERILVVPGDPIVELVLTKKRRR